MSETITKLTKVNCGDDACYFVDKDAAKAFAAAADEATRCDEYDAACGDLANGIGVWSRPDAAEKWGEVAADEAREITAF